MKALLFALTLAATFSSPTVFAQAEAPAKTTRPLPMNARADEIDASSHAFTQVTKDGRRVRNVVTAETVIKQGTADARFEDIKIGDYVSGSRMKVSDTEYRVIKITKFGPREPKAPKKESVKQS